MPEPVPAKVVSVGNAYVKGYIVEHPNRIDRPAGGGGSNMALLFGALIVVLAVIGYFAWAGGYFGPQQTGTSVTAQTPTRRPVVPNTQLPANNPPANVTPDKPVNNTPATNTPKPQ